MMVTTAPTIGIQASNLQALQQKGLHGINPCLSPACVCSCTTKLFSADVNSHNSVVMTLTASACRWHSKQKTGQAQSWRTDVFQVQNAFTCCSFASSCIIGWVLGPGDFHLCHMQIVWHTQVSVAPFPLGLHGRHCVFACLMLLIHTIMDAACKSKI